jgi:hypothetical protein
MVNTSSTKMINNRQKTLSTIVKHMVNTRQNTWSNIIQKHCQTSQKTTWSTIIQTHCQTSSKNMVNNRQNNIVDNYQNMVTHRQKTWSHITNKIMCLLISCVQGRTYCSEVDIGYSIQVVRFRRYIICQLMEAPCKHIQWLLLFFRGY